jgi:glycosyltransferase involved in cell wall biosynthesis
MHFSLIVPVHDQAATVAEDLWLLSQQAARISPDWELVVVDRGSRDRTPEILERMRQQEPRLILIYHARTRGLGEAWRSALIRARGEVLAVLDRSGEWQWSALPPMVEELETCDLLAGYHRRAPVVPGRRRAGWALRGCLGLDPRILDGGVFLMKRTLFQHVGLVENGEMVPWELASRTVRQGGRVRLLPVPFFALAGRPMTPPPTVRAIWRLARHVRRPSVPLFSPGHEASTASLRLDFLHQAGGSGPGQLSLER